MLKMVQHKRNIPDPVVALPHDGPLLLIRRQSCDDKGDTYPSSTCSGGLKEALELLLRSEKNCNNNNLNDNDNDPQTNNVVNELPIFKFSMQLISQLQMATSLKDQLASLRAYKSNIINVQKLEPFQLQNKSLLPTIIGMYRIILELCLSHETPQIMKKAGYSCVSTLLRHSCSPQIKYLFDEIHVSVLNSIISGVSGEQKSPIMGSTCHVWKEPVQTLFDILSYGPTQVMVMHHHNKISSIFRLLLLQGSKFNKALEMKVEGQNGSMNEVVSAKVLQSVSKVFEVCITFKVILTLLVGKQENLPLFTVEEKEELSDLCVSIIDDLFKPLLSCRAASTDALSCCGICLIQILSLKWRLETSSDKVITENVTGFIRDLIYVNDKVELANSLPSVMIIKGLASTLTDKVLVTSTENEPIIGTISSYMLQTFQYSSNDAIRLWSLKGLETVLGRCKSMIVSSGEILPLNYFTELARDVLQLSLLSFDSPPGRQVATAIPGLFKSLVNMMEVLDQYDSDYSKTLESMEILVSRILAQPASRKGKYIALESLLYKVGASKLLQLAALQGSECLVSLFVKEIGDRGNSATAVAELLGKILSLLREEMHNQEGIDLNRMESKKERRKKDILIRGQVADDETLHETVMLLPQWMDVWVPSFASELLCASVTRRNNIASYCLPLIQKMVGGPSRKVDACHSFAALLTEINCREGAKEHILWAKLELIRHIGLQKLLKRSIGCQVLDKSISNSVTIDLLKKALIHESSRVRMVAFQTIAYILPSLSEISAQNACTYISVEMQLWNDSLPYIFNCAEKEHMVVISNALHDLLLRIMEVETTCHERNKSSMLTHFVNDLLLNELFMKQAYPGTISEKESFALKILETIINFSFILHSDNDGTSKTSENCNENIAAVLLSQHIFSTLLSLLHSNWDTTRESSFHCICTLIEQSKRDGLSLPKIVTCHDSYNLLLIRATHLASSPRQREADTGAKLLAILCAVLSTCEQRKKYLENLIILTTHRLRQMAQFLGVEVTIDRNDNDSKQSWNSHKEQLPLAHGLIQGLRLIIDTILSKPEAQSQSLVFADLIHICCRAIEVSLVVVADFNDDVVDDNLYLEQPNLHSKKLQFARTNKNGSTPLNVNTGALGANATFASCKAVSEKEHLIRLSMQRVLVGSWLLTKEACATLSSAIELFPDEIDIDIVSNAGELLLTTLTSLKHQGAAFAAHRSLQKICVRCNKEGDRDGIRLLPSKWSHRLLYEITSPEIVRNSTLRRSTGYGLGTLSILRTEDGSGPKFLFRNVIASIIRLSLPPTTIMNEYIKRWKFAADMDMFTYIHSLSGSDSHFVDTQSKDSQGRTRIHALNILRLIILDGHLSSEMKQFIGDCLISALIGYSDTSWNLRNSSTMTFVAVMLRVVDADKNASGKTKRSRSRVKVGTNAITATELFRNYPPLASALIALMQEEIEVKTVNMVHSTLFPVLLLLSRLQPLSASRIDPSADDISQAFISPVILCLGHVHQKVRMAAACAVAVLCIGDDYKGIDHCTSRGALIKRCSDLLSSSSSFERINHNQDHGALLAIKCLLQHCNMPSTHISKELQKALLYYASWGNFQGSCPPVCSVIALEIWQMLCDKLGRKGEDDSEVFQKQLMLDTACKVVKYTELASKRTNIIGLSVLGSNSARVIVESIFPIEYKFIKSKTNKLDLVKDLICSDFYDVMLHSVKAFKKKICCSVDSIVVDQETPIETRIDTLKCIGKMLLSCLFFIMARDNNLSHPPTIRRICRCVIEVAQGYKGLSKHGQLSDLSNYSSPQLFQNLGSIMLIEKSATGCIGRNVIELMGMIIPELCAHNQLEQYTRNCFEKDLTMYIQAIGKAAGSDSSWKVRYSAALSLNWSGLIMHHPENQHFEAVINRSRFLVHFQMISLLHDSDEDVRKAAATAIQSSLLNPSTSLRNLEVAYEGCNALFTLLMNQVYSYCKDIQFVINQNIIEFSRTIEIKDQNLVQNIAADRPIFEEEDRNIVEESLLMVHLSIFKLTKVSSNVPDDSINNLSMELVKLCISVLNQMTELASKTKGYWDVEHNLSWTGTVFPALHCLLLGAAFSIFQFGIDSSQIIKESKKFMEECTFIHPFIEKALSLLLIAKHKDDKTCKELQNCCFLVPSSNIVKQNVNASEDDKCSVNIYL